jgi:hypothetical protein
MSIENWKDIVDFPAYEVSDHGRVRNKKFGRILKIRLENGYPRVNLRKNKCKIQRQFRIHRLVAEAFLPNENYGHIVTHVDRNKPNNMQHAFKSEMGA